MAEIETLVDDIADLLEEGVEEVNPELSDKYGKLFKELLETRLVPRPLKEKGTLRMSNIGKPCERQVWYDVNIPNDGEPLKAHTKLKFLYGDAIELLMLFLAEASGHTVEGTQDTQEINGIKGHRDGVIDGVLVDVKSASPFSFEKFASGTLTPENDAFGYITQIQSYLEAGQTDEVVKDKNRAAFFVADKTNGHFCLDPHPRETKDYTEVYEAKKKMVDQPEPPERAFTDIPEGQSGNLRLSTNCSYCPFKWQCWPGLRGFAYSNGPKYLTTVKLEPKVKEFFPTHMGQ